MGERNKKAEPVWYWCACCRASVKWFGADCPNCVTEMREEGVE